MPELESQIFHSGLEKKLKINGYTHFLREVDRGCGLPQPNYRNNPGFALYKIKKTDIFD